MKKSKVFFLIYLFMYQLHNIPEKLEQRIVCILHERIPSRAKRAIKRAKTETEGSEIAFRILPGQELKDRLTSAPVFTLPRGSGGFIIYSVSFSRLGG